MTDWTFRLLSAITFTPLVGALIIAILPAHAHRAIRYTALVTRDAELQLTG